MQAVTERLRIRVLVVAERRRKPDNRSRPGSPKRGDKSSRSGGRSSSKRGATTSKRGATARAGGDEKRRSDAPAVHLSDDIVKELRATARPGKGEILIKVFSEAGGAFAADDFDEAIRLGEQAKHIALRSATVRELLGLAYYRVGKWKEAARELAAFRRIGGSTEQNPVLADCYRAMGKPEKAVEIVAEIDGRGVDEAVVYEGAIVGAGALADMKRLDEAVQKLEALELRPQTAREHHLRAWYVLGDLLERKGRFTQAREWFEAVNGADAELTDAGERLARLQRRSG